MRSPLGWLLFAGLSSIVTPVASADSPDNGNAPLFLCLDLAGQLISTMPSALAEKARPRR